MRCHAFYLWKEIKEDSNNNDNIAHKHLFSLSLPGLLVSIHPAPVPFRRPPRQLYVRRDHARKSKSQFPCNGSPPSSCVFLTSGLSNFLFQLNRMSHSCGNARSALAQKVKILTFSCLSTLFCILRRKKIEFLTIPSLLSFTVKLLELPRHGRRARNGRRYPFIHGGGRRPFLGLL